MATITKDVSNLAELKAALQSASAGDTLNINITKDITVGQPALPAPRAWVETDAAKINIYGNSHTISGINLPSQVYSKSLIYIPDGGKVDIHDIKILNALCIDTPLVKSNDYLLYLNLYNSTLTGNFNLFFKGDNTHLEQSNIAETTGNRVTFPDDVKDSHIYVSLLTPSATPSDDAFYSVNNSYIEINDKFGALNFDKVNRLFINSKNSCINLISNVSGSINKNIATQGVCIFNATHAPNIKSTAPKVIGVTDDQMKNADYLNSIGFAVTPTN